MSFGAMALGAWVARVGYIRTRWALQHRLCGPCFRRHRHFKWAANALGGLCGVWFLFWPIITTVLLVDTPGSIAGWIVCISFPALLALALVLAHGARKARGIVARRVWNEASLTLRVPRKVAERLRTEPEKG